MMGSGSVWGWSGAIMMIFFWLLIILAIWAVIKRISGQEKDLTRDSTAHKSAIEILKERYARGEINKKEFEEMKKDLA